MKTILFVTLLNSIAMALTNGVTCEAATTLQVIVDDIRYRISKYVDIDNFTISIPQGLVDALDEGDITEIFTYDIRAILTNAVMQSYNPLNKLVVNKMNESTRDSLLLNVHLFNIHSQVHSRILDFLKEYSSQEVELIDPTASSTSETKEKSPTDEGDSGNGPGADTGSDDSSNRAAVS